MGKSGGSTDSGDGVGGGLGPAVGFRPSWISLKNQAGMNDVCS